MTIISTLAAPTSTHIVNPTPTELERWKSDAFISARIFLENLDATQVLSGWLESRPVYGSGSFARVGETIWIDTQPLEARDQQIPSSTVGAGEMRFMASFDGAGGSAKYTRRWLHLVNT